MSDRPGYLDGISKLTLKEQDLAFTELTLYGNTFVMVLTDGTAKHIPLNEVVMPAENTVSNGQV